MVKNKKVTWIKLIVLISLGIVVFFGVSYYLGQNPIGASNDLPSLDKDCGFNGEKSIKEDQNIQIEDESNKTTTEAEESPTENFREQPGAIKSLKSKGNDEWLLSVDLLTRNKDWTPGDDKSGPFFLNQNSKIRDLSLNSHTKINNCTSQNKDYASSFENSISSFIKYAEITINDNKSSIIAYMDISGTKITAIYEQCLP